MKFFFYITSILLLLFTSIEVFPQQQKDYTILIYLDGSDLETNNNSGTNDMAEMMNVSFTDFVNIIVLTGGSKKNGWQTIKSWRIEAGKKTELDFIPVNNKMSDPANLTKFINWGIQNYPAKKYVLDLWNHGMAIRGYGHDENTDAHLKVPQIKDAIANTNFIKEGKTFELLGFDACLMATIEVQTMVKDFAKYFVGSEETEPGHGWNYTPIVTAMENGDGSGQPITGIVLGQTIIDGFKTQSETEKTSNVTLSLIEMSKVPSVVTTLEALFAKIKQDSKVRSLQQARGRAEEYSKSIKSPADSEDMVDIGDLMKELKKVDATLATEADAVLNAVNAAVLYSKHDNTRPRATGISMFLPHNKFARSDWLQETLTDDYNPINFSTSINDFIVSTYIPTVQSDTNPPSGTPVTKGLELKANGLPYNPDSISYMNITHANDLEQIQVILLEEFEDNPDEFIVLGSTYPDTSFVSLDGSETYGYHWDELWLGINGFPAYISDIQYFEENEDHEAFTRIHIPAILNPDEDSNGRDIIISYRYDDNFNTILESIVPETYGENVLIPGKERINLVPGDRVQLLYESFNEVTNEEFFVVDDEAIFTIENGNEDLHLEYDYLYEGKYRLGYILMDHSHNDTIIFDNKIFRVQTTSIDATFANNNINLYPNPSNQEFSIDNNQFNGEAYTIRLFDLTGRLLFTNTYTQQKAVIETSKLPQGYYAVELIAGSKVYRDKVVIQH